MSQTQPMTRLEVVDIETNVATKTIYLAGHNAQEIQAMSDSLLRNLNTFQFFVRATPSAGPVAEAGKAFQKRGSCIDKKATQAVLPAGWSFKQFENGAFSFGKVGGESYTFTPFTSPGNAAMCEFVASLLVVSAPATTQGA